MKFNREEYKEFYKKMTSDEKGEKGFYPYEYQIEVAKLLIEGKNVILSVPTGAGKTWASIMPFLFLFYKKNDLFPKKMIYSLPLRALCNSISEDVNKTIEKTEFEGLSAIQTGEFSEDKYFEKDIVFSTIDQTLSNFLCFPLPLSPRQANINTGALIGSYLVFDEFHLLDNERSMATTLGMLRMFEKLNRFCIMTATLSDGFIDNLIKGLALKGVEVEKVTLSDFPEDKKLIGSLKVPEGNESKKEIEVVKTIITSEKIKKYHKDKTIVICNRVETAQRIYMELESWADKNGIELVCLHSRFFDRHRKAKEKKLKELFGKEKKNEKTNSILISTQVIEAGMDISCEIMHTEIAPINALLQRVGRCARYEGESGKIFVYDVLDSEEKAKIDVEDFKNLSREDKSEIRKLNNKYLPYNADLCKTTFEKLDIAKNQQLNEEVTIRLVNEILKEEEGEIWNGIVSDNFKYEGIRQSWEASVSNQYGAKKFYRELIRNIQSTEVVIIDNPDFAIKVPFSLESVGVFKWSMIKWVKEVFDVYQNEFDEESDFWIVGVIREEEDSFLEQDESETVYKFHSLKDMDDVKDSHETLFLNKDLFNYHSTIGFNKHGKGNVKSNFKERKEKETFIHAYRKDTFIQHTEGLLGAFQKDFLKDGQLDFVFKAFNEQLKTNIDFKKLIQLILILHDYGKLNNKWQDWMQDYQKTLSVLHNPPFTYQENVPLGHTGFDTKQEKEKLGEKYEEIVKKIEKSIKDKRKKRPSHSGVGALVIFDILEKWLGENLWEKLFIPAAYAIARHHGVSNDKCPKFKISDHNFQPMKQLLYKYGFEGYKISQEEVVEELEELDYGHTTFLKYLFFVRILRMCDQKATDDFEKYLN